MEYALPNTSRLPFSDSLAIPSNIPFYSGAINSSATQLCGVWGSSSPIILARQKLAELASEQSDDDYLAPTGAAIACTHSLLIRSLQILGARMPLPHIASSGDGGVRIEWAGSSRHLRIAIPKTGVGGYIYHESGDEYGAEGIATDTSLHRWLRWFTFSQA
jgi:hypothetical protein